MSRGRIAALEAREQRRLAYLKTGQCTVFTPKLGIGDRCGICNVRRLQHPQPLPVPVKTDSRICFAIAFFTTEADAGRFAEQVRKNGDTYNGGFFHGMACGREKGWDYTDEKLGPLFAVTTR